VEGSDLCLPQRETGVIICMYVCHSALSPQSKRPDKKVQAVPLLEIRGQSKVTVRNNLKFPDKPL
jgi:hypothetical protein